MSIIKVRSVDIGEGTPKICVSITKAKREQIIEMAKIIEKESSIDIVEWRVDYYEDVLDYTCVVNLLKDIKKILGKKLLLFTFRTMLEGGKMKITTYNYEKLNLRILEENLIDLIDIELSLGDEVVKSLVEKSHANNITVIISNHDLEKTPRKKEIISRVLKMRDLGGDILKIAVMPLNNKDVLRLLMATEEISRLYNDKPLITISMGKMGIISRLTGEIFGSAITFATINDENTLGHLRLGELEKILNIIHKTKSE
ncbi:MAG: type I 3-dehydroquinate dehydratase [Filifactoraceae bacterium]